VVPRKDLAGACIIQSHTRVHSLGYSCARNYRALGVVLVTVSDACRYSNGNVKSCDITRQMAGCRPQTTKAPHRAGVKPTRATL